MLKKNTVTKVFLIFVLIPVVVFIFSGTVGANSDNLNSINFFAILVALFGSIGTMFVNYYTGYNSKFWYILLSILIILFIIILLLIQIGSNFGF